MRGPPEVHELEESNRGPKVPVGVNDRSIELLELLKTNLFQGTLHPEHICKVLLLPE